MFSRKLLVFVAASALLLLVATVTTAQNEPTSVNVQIRDLLTQKLDVLKERLEGAKQRFDAGQIPQDRLLRARLDLLRAELDLANSRADRIAVLESQLQTRQELEQLHMRRHSDGPGTLETRLIATADRLDAEIALLREKAKQ